VADVCFYAIAFCFCFVTSFFIIIVRACFLFFLFSFVRWVGKLNFFFNCFILPKTEGFVQVKHRYFCFPFVHFLEILSLYFLFWGCRTLFGEDKDWEGISSTKSL